MAKELFEDKEISKERYKELIKEVNRWVLQIKTMPLKLKRY